MREKTKVDIVDNRSQQNGMGILMRLTRKDTNMPLCKMK